MPTYEFVCYNHLCPTARFTVRLNMGKSQDADCPACGEKAERVYTAPAVQTNHTPKFHPERG